MAVVEVEPVTDENWPALEDLFGRGGASNGCWCMYWLLGPEYHRRPREQNKQALRKATGSDVSPGLLALDDDGRAVGWARLSPRSELDWLNQRRDLAPVDDLPVWALPCFYVRSRQRAQPVPGHAHRVRAGRVRRGGTAQAGPPDRPPPARLTLPRYCV